MSLPALFRSTTLAAVLLAASAPVLLAQVHDAQEWLEQCRAGGYSGSGRHERHCELRELTLPATGRALEVDGGANGGVSVYGWDRNEIRVQALIQTHAATLPQAEADAREIQVRTDDHRVRAEGPRGDNARGWAVSYRVYVPRQSDLSLRATNGGLRLENVGGRIEMQTSNGGIHLDGVSGDVRGRTSNGGVNVRLDGRGWQGAGLDVQTSNGGINLQVPDGYSARLEAGTTNGGINTEFPVTVQGDVRRNLSTQLGQGGAPLRLQTTNGSIRIRRS
jgi:DUF4097 and DUF4098 domain-containing protein YvlB